MQNKFPELGPLGTKFFAYAQMRGLDMVRLGELQKRLGLSPIQERRLLARLNADGLLFRLQRGIYIVPASIPPGGYWRPNDYLIVAKYMQIHNARYYIGGLTAFNKHGFSTQIPNQLTVYNDKISGKKNFGGITIRFIKVIQDHIIGFDTIGIESGQENYNVANLARTILDAINDWKNYHMLPEAYLWLKKYCLDIIFLKEFVELTAKCANNNSIRRIGFWLEKIGVEADIILPLSKMLLPTKGWVPLIPNKARQGKTSNKWRIIDNAK